MVNNRDLEEAVMNGIGFLVRSILALVFGFLLIFPSAAVAAHPPSEGETVHSNILSKKIVSFVPNKGQITDTDGNVRPDVLYTANVPGGSIHFFRDHISCVFGTVSRKMNAGISEATGQKIDGEDRAGQMLELHRMDIIFDGHSDLVNVHAEGKLPGHRNFYLAHCPEGITNVPHFKRLVYREIYPNIDLVFIGGTDRWKYEFIVRPGGDTENIRLRYSGGAIHTKL